MKTLFLSLLILLALLLSAAAYLLFAPFRIKLDSSKKSYRMGWTRWLGVRLIREKEQWLVRLNAPFWKRSYPVDDLIFNEVAGKKPKKEKKKSKSKYSKMSLSKFIRILRQLKIREFKLLLDTDNYMWNAYLVPVFEMFRFKTGYRTQINFNGKNEIKLNARTRMINMLRAGIFQHIL